MLDAFVIGLMVAAFYTIYTDLSGGRSKQAKGNDVAWLLGAVLVLLIIFNGA